MRGGRKADVRLLMPSTIMEPEDLGLRSDARDFPYGKDAATVTDSIEVD
jgi:hypothetical protein